MNVIILGMHRSGTSLASGLLALSGVHFGIEEEFIASNDENPKGFWERRDVRELNDNLLHHMGCDWSEISNLYKKEIPDTVITRFNSKSAKIVTNLKEESNSGVIGLKEPRLCLLMPFWEKSLNDENFYILVCRDPNEIAVSLEKRNAIPPLVSNYLTECYTKRAINAVKKKPHYIVTFNDLIEQPVETIERILNKINQNKHSLVIKDKSLLLEYSTPSLYRSKTFNRKLATNKRLQNYYESLKRGELPNINSSKTLVPKSVLNYEHSKRFEEFKKTTNQLKKLKRRTHTLEQELSNRLDTGLETVAKETQINELHTEIDLRDTKLKQIRLENSEAVKQLSERDEQIIDLRKSFEEKTVAKETQINELHTEIDLRDTQLKQIRLENSEAVKQLSERDEQIIDLRKSFEEKTVAKETQINELHTEIDLRDTKLKQIRLENSEAVKQLSERDEQITRLKKSTEDLNCELKKRKERIHRFEQKAAKLQLELTAAKNETHRQIKQNEALTFKIEKLLSASEQLETKLKITNDKLVAKSQHLIIAQSQQGILQTYVQRLELEAKKHTKNSKVSSNEISLLRLTLQNTQEYLNTSMVLADGVVENLNSLHSSHTWHLSKGIISLMLNPIRLGMGPTVLGEIERYTKQYEKLSIETKKFLNLECKVSPTIPGTSKSTFLDSLPLSSELSSAPRQSKVNNLFSQFLGKKGQTVKVGFVVTEDVETTNAGDFFTAKELAIALQSELGWEHTYLPEFSKSIDWHDVSNLDILFVLLDKYDLSKVHGQNKPMLKIAWPRNWVDRWTIRPWFSRYDVVLSTSKIARKFIFEQTGIDAPILRIATNTDRFYPTVNKRAEFQSDYCFTGNYWGAPRQVEKIKPTNFPYKFALFGTGWDQHPQFEGFNRGKLSYNELSSAYANTKILIDDANHVTEPWASVNSRVFDALATGTLVITNGIAGARETFGELLPTYSSVPELEQKLQYFLTHDDERKNLVEKLRELVLKNHSYKRRACQLEGVLNNELSTKGRIAIKLPVPDSAEAVQWGDFHFGKSLASALRKMGYAVRLDFMPDWYTKHTIPDDIVLVIRGLSIYKPDNSQLNLLWVISHPDDIYPDEYEIYNHVFVASKTYADRLRSRLNTSVTTLLQCTDPERFFIQNDQHKLKNVMFVGNSRKQLRPIVSNAIEADLQIKVIGKDWDHLIDNKFIVGEYLENSALNDIYSTSGVLLCDHWEDMKKHGFISNRLFDVTACGAVPVSDDVPGINDIFEGLVYTYSGSPDDLSTQVRSALSEPSETKLRRAKLAKKVAKEHSFDARAKVLDSVISKSLPIQRFSTFLRGLEYENLYAEAIGEISSARGIIEAQQMVTGTLNNEIIALQKQFEAVQNSYSWKITAPIRRSLELMTSFPSALIKKPKTIIDSNESREKREEISKPE